jgi:hypothetical protein
MRQSGRRVATRRQSAILRVASLTPDVRSAGRSERSREGEPADGAGCRR